ncbi:MAG: MarR family transcriptional regulator [Alphaproteobacteria bacterium]|nr:MAG: MarR family transcriptional regulator [Alphaproteobacteria bacterium]
MAKFDITDSPGHLLRRAQQYAFDLFSAEIGNSNLTPRQFTVLLTVQQNEGCSQTDLVKMTGIDRSTLADMISRLIDRKLLSRTRTKEDARANAVKITAAGKKQVASHMNSVKKAETKILSVLPVSQRTSFMNSLKTIAAAADELDAGGTKPAAPKTRKAAKTKPAAKKSAKKAAKKSAKKAAKKTAKRKTKAKKKK